MVLRWIRFHGIVIDRTSIGLTSAVWEMPSSSSPRPVDTTGLFVPDGIRRHEMDFVGSGDEM